MLQVGTLGSPQGKKKSQETRRHQDGNSDLGGKLIRTFPVGHAHDYHKIFISDLQWHLIKSDTLQFSWLYCVSTSGGS